MERRKALATAASVSAVALAATIALGANVGLFGLTSDGKSPGSFELVDSKSSEPIVRTEIVDVPVTAPGSGGSTSGPNGTPSVSATGAQPTPTVGTAPHADDDHGSDDDSHDEEPEHDEDD